MMPCHTMRPIASTRPHQYQRGAALFVVVMVSMVVTLLGVQLVSQLTSNTRTAMGEQDVSWARMAAEAALRDAERDVSCQQWNGTAYVYWAYTNQTGGNPRAHCIVNPTSVGAKSSVALAKGPTGSEGCTKGMQLAPAAAASAAAVCPEIDYGEVTGAPALTVGSASYAIDVISVSDGQVGQAVPYYRIRARGQGRNANTSVVLESVFRPL